MVELLFWFIFYLFFNTCAYITFQVIDLIKKQKNGKLIKLSKCKFLFNRDKKDPTKKDYISIVSLILQIINFLFNIIMFIIIILNITVFKSEIYFKIIFKVIMTYSILSFVSLLFSAIKLYFLDDEKPPKISDESEWKNIKSADNFGNIIDNNNNKNTIKNKKHNKKDKE